ncbi:TRAP transporter large permease [Rhodobium gokarnense]|uniref:TRAP-type C4-dicarboxylate transport system permease large subunit n=1 Tax=Rhodobium gokarnense TaxID=364296 RepID=A0ABT3HIH5_9HYPH|nr:TRAP transporter large permease [Rhodobium gokarnense]MCW2310210.1 TRAP-type C4-dicarboxylate transport system permease large subunit [Rhodobium gokarnense]
MDQQTLIFLISIGVTLLFLIGVPIFLVIGFWVIGVSIVIDFTLANLGVTLYEGLNFFGLLALPLFILTGDLINGAGIAKRLSDFAYSILGWLRGGLAMAALGACGLFAAISGSNSATTAAIGSIMHPEMVKGGYDENFAAATAASGGTVGIIIPPSIIFIVYGFLMNLSISDLFIGGLLPGVMMVAAMQAACWWICHKNGWGHLIQLRLKRIIGTAFGAWLGFFAIGLVLWGIYTGAFSPTEAAGVTAGFCAIAGLVCYPIHKVLMRIQDRRGRPQVGDDVAPDAEGGAHVAEIDSRGILGNLVVPGFSPLELPTLIMRSGQITGLLAPLIAISVVMQQILTLLGAKAFVTGMLGELGGYYAILFACMGIVLIAGTILESLPNTIILAPILAPIAASIGVDPIHFAVIFLIGDAIGFITPPYGLNLYVASGITGIPYFRLLRYTMPYLFALIAVWVIVALVPQLSTILLFNTGAGVYQ